MRMSVLAGARSRCAASPILIHGCILPSCAPGGSRQAAAACGGRALPFPFCLGGGPTLSYLGRVRRERWTGATQAAAADSSSREAGGIHGRCAWANPAAFVPAMRGFRGPWQLGSRSRRVTHALGRACAWMRRHACAAAVRPPLYSPAPGSIAGVCQLAAAAQRHRAEAVPVLRALARTPIHV